MTSPQVLVTVTHSN